MEFYLIKNKPLEFHVSGGFFSVSHHDGPVSTSRRTAPMPIKVEPVVRNGKDPDLEFYSNALTKSLYENAGIVDQHQEQWIGNCCLLVNVGMVRPSSGGHGHVQIGDSGNRKQSPGFMESLLKVFGADNVGMNFVIKDFSCDACVDFGLSGRSLPIVMGGKFTTKRLTCGFEIGQVSFPESMWAPWNSLEKSFLGRLSVTITVNHEVVNSLFLTCMYVPSVINSEITLKRKSMLTNATCSDLVIEAANGAEIKCHKTYLAENSDVFAAMFQSKMREGTSNRLELRDMSEAGVCGLLAFIYCWDVKAASESCDVALELFQAAHRFNIPTLENTMRLFFSVKPNDWYTVDMTVKLLLFVNNLKDDEQMKKVLKKAGQVLRWFCITSPDSIRSSVEYQRLFQNSLETAMEFSMLFLEVK